MVSSEFAFKYGLPINLLNCRVCSPEFVIAFSPLATGAGPKLGQLTVPARKGSIRAALGDVGMPLQWVANV